MYLRYCQPGLMLGTRQGVVAPTAAPYEVVTRRGLDDRRVAVVSVDSHRQSSRRGARFWAAWRADPDYSRNLSRPNRHQNL